MLLYDDAGYASVGAAARPGWPHGDGLRGRGGAGSRTRRTTARRPGRSGWWTTPCSGDLATACASVRRGGLTLNQAVAELPPTGEAPGWLRDAVQRCQRALNDPAAVTAELARGLVLCR